MRSIWLAAAVLGCSEQGLSDNSEAVGDLVPDIAVEPSDLDFGTLPEGTVVTKSVRIVNRGAERLDVTRVLLGPSVVFTVPDLEATYFVEPGEAVLQEVQYTAINAMDTSWLRILSDDPDTPELDVPLVGRALVPELTIDPDPLSFGTIQCDEIAPVILRNTGEAPLTVDAAILSGEAFTFAEEPPLPQVLAPGGFVGLQIAFEPGPGDLDHFGSIVVDSDDPRGVRTGQIDGTGVGPPSHLDIFEQVENDWTKVDMMFFVDRSGSMGDDATNLGTNFSTFIDILVTGGIDYQIAVVTQDSGCHNEVIITPLTVDGEGRFLSAVQGPGGAFYESGMIVTTNALEQTDAGECNGGFLRPGVTPISVMVSDEPEQSPGGWSAFLPLMLAKVPDLVISAVVGQSVSSCGAADGTGYHEPAAATGGADLDICDPDWGSYFYDIIGVIEPPLSEFLLSATPDPSTIAVSIDGAAASGWAYDAALNAVVFTEVSLPPPASVIEVAYDGILTCL